MAGRVSHNKLIRSRSGDTLCRGVDRPIWRNDLRRSDSFLRELRPWAPKCPSGVDSEWQFLAQRLRAAFFRCSDVSPDHPARQCLSGCDIARLRDALFSRGEWKAGAYTRTLLLKGDAFNVMLLCWAPGCASPVHGHSCIHTHVNSNCFMLVLEGQLAETVYGEDSISTDGKSVNAQLGKTRLHSAGTLAYINDSVGLHKVANTTDGRAVSLHVYAPGWRQPPLFDEIFPEVDAGGAEIDAAAGVTFEGQARHGSKAKGALGCECRQLLRYNNDDNAILCLTTQGTKKV
eukprot:CAMPEP_0119068518 /NCGR_PEP_ID=MMETSP1178-20130426/10967_1 /TAXON_ID=33656 /ORGANISM="unid sp, Strain CCMP2000" /LENGTH=288 /DNA_ID=CAMNT_0007050233 /DNA_START=21 /DNA_END=888 /DNA_ORIENTATION=-